MNPRNRSWMILLLAAWIAGCNLKLMPAQPVALSAVGPRAWIDAPLDGMRLPLEPYEIVFHITDPVSVAQGELSINGAVQAVLPNPDPSQNLATLRYEWDPQAPGKYTIRARGQNGSGEWSDYAQVIVEIGSPTITPTATMTATMTATSTLSLTPTPPPAEFSIVNVSSKNIYYRGLGCGPQIVTITAGVEWAKAINYVGFFYRLQDQATAAVTDWQNKTMFKINASPPPLYRVMVDVVSEISGYSSYAKAWFQYQIVAKDGSGDQIRSALYSDIVLSVCNV
jgi:hypothetical protein